MATAHPRPAAPAAPPGAGAPLEASGRLGLLDEHRIPYRIAGAAGAPWRRLAGPQPARALHWHVAPPGAAVAEHRVWDLPVWGAVAPEAELARLVAGLPGHWQPVASVLDAAGAARSSVWRSSEGGTVLPFDPDEVIANWRAERYRETRAGLGRRAKGAARMAYYRARPLLPRAVQLALRRSYTGVQARPAFPRWPVEPALHDFTDRLLGLVADVAGAPVPYLAPWPAGRSWALILTHDVELAAGRDAIERVRAVEAALGLRSSWNLVPERYHVGDDLVAGLWASGCEVGVHGLRHDGRDLESLRTLSRRLPEMRRWAERWQAVGFRAPATHRVWDWMPLLGFDYDTSYPDTDPYEPMDGGCCTWLPFFNRGMVELPITLPQDHTVFEILRVGTAVWHEKTELLRARGGLATVLTHPDYLLEDAELDAYRRYLEAFAEDPDVWHALPCEVSEWWRRRAATAIERSGDEWRASGPAAGEAAIRLLSPAV